MGRPKIMKMHGMFLDVVPRRGRHQWARSARASGFACTLLVDLSDIGIEDLTVQSYKEAGYPDIEAYLPTGPEREERRKRRALLALWFASAIAALGIMLTATGVVAALWYMALWVGVVVLCVSVLSPVVVVLMLVYAWPSGSDVEKELKANYPDTEKPGPRRP